MRHFYKAKFGGKMTENMVCNHEHGDQAMLFDVDLGFYERAWVHCFLVGVKIDAHADEMVLAYVKKWFEENGPEVCLETITPEEAGPYLAVVKPLDRPGAQSLNNALIARGWGGQ